MGRNTQLARRQVNDFRAVRLDLVPRGSGSVVRLGFEGRVRNSNKWELLGVYALLNPDDIKWLRTELQRAGDIAATVSEPGDLP